MIFKLKKLNMKKIIPTLFPVLFLALYAFYISMQTNFFPLGDYSLSHDAGIFAYIGMAMSKGRVLYTQAWENKGPVLYFINYLGILLQPKHGIFVVEYLSIFIAMLFSYKTLKIFTNKWVSAISTFFVFSMLIVTLERGNLSEEYALPFLCIGLYYFVKYLYQQYSLKKYELILLGSMLSFVFLLRANILALFVAMFSVLLIYMLVDKKLKELRNANLVWNNWFHFNYYSVCHLPGSKWGIIRLHKRCLFGSIKRV